MADNGATCPMHRSGDVWDDAALERFSSLLKTERIGRKVYRAHNRAETDMFDHRARFCNPGHRHPALGCLSAIDFGKQQPVLVSAKPAAAQGTAFVDGGHLRASAALPASI
ncbi:hypothetical protein [Sphingobium aquiterrae]|uniref:hypothetical protein n=1 Tax=Sphingobium aquiterrae TaxID=2038656 RepID=UPI003017D350